MSKRKVGRGATSALFISTRTYYSWTGSTRLDHLVPMDALSGTSKRRARRRWEALKRSRGKAARQSARSPAGRAGKKRVTLHLAVNKWRELKMLATSLGTTMDALMRCGLDLVLAERKAKHLAVKRSEIRRRR